MAGGQCLDLEADKLGTPARPDIAHIQRLQAMKTGALIRYACEAGAILGQADASGAGRLRNSASGWERPSRSPTTCSTSKARRRSWARRPARMRARPRSYLFSVCAEARTRLGLLEAQAIVLLEPFGSAADILREAARFVGATQGVSEMFRQS